MNRPDEIAALASAIAEYRSAPTSDAIYSSADVANILQMWTDRLSATSPGDAVRMKEACKLAVTELDCMYLNGERVPYGGIPADPESSMYRKAIQDAEAAIDALAPAEKAGNVPTTFYSVLNKAGVEYSAYSCGGVNLFGDKGSISKAVDAFHSHSQIDDLKTQIRHWRDECGKLHSKAATPTPPSADVAKKAYAALFEPAESDAVDNLEGALIDIKRLSDAGKPTDAVCIRTIERVQQQLIKAHEAFIQSAAHGGGTKSDGGVEGHAHEPQHGSAFEGSACGRPDKAEAGIKPGPSDPAQEPSVTTFGGSSPCFGRPGDARNTYVDAQEPDAVAYLHRHRKFGRDLQFTQLEACDREQGWTEQPLYRTRPVSLDREAVLDELSYILEGIILRRLREDKIAGYVFETAKEQTDAILALIEGMT